MDVLYENTGKAASEPCRALHFSRGQGKPGRLDAPRQVPGKAKPRVTIGIMNLQGSSWCWAMSGASSPTVHLRCDLRMALTTCHPLSPGLFLTEKSLSDTTPFSHCLAPLISRHCCAVSCSSVVTPTKAMPLTLVGLPLSPSGS